MRRRLKDPILENKVVIIGMVEIIEKDLKKAETVKDMTVKERAVWKQAISSEVRKKRHYRSLIGGEKFNDTSLRASIDQMNQNINQLNHKIVGADQKIDFQDTIITTLRKNLKEHRQALEEFAKSNQ